MRVHGRGTGTNPGNRFEEIHLEEDLSGLPPEELAALAADLERGRGRRGPPPVYLRDASRTIVSRNASPDIPFDRSVNPYRGCTHGCAYCYARPTHEFLGMSAGLDFETKILVKEDAPALLRRELARRSWTPQVVALSGVTDPYQPVERTLGITRGCIEVLAETRNPVAIVTKNHLVTRDIDHLAELARHDAVVVMVSVTTLDPDLVGKLEPRTSRPARRLDAIRTLAEAGIPVGVLVAPVIPGLTDHEMPRILEAAAAAGATRASKVMLRLPYGLGDLFEAWLEEHVPTRRERVLGRIRELRGGGRNDPRFGARMRGEGIWAEQLDRLFAVACRKAGLDGDGRRALSTEAFRRPRTDGQLDLFV